MDNLSIPVENENGLAVNTEKVLRKFRYNELPTLQGAMDRLKRDIESDEYVDVTSNVGSIGMDNVGRLIMSGFRGEDEHGTQYVRPSRKALADILNFIDVPRNTLEVLTALSPGPRAHAFNDFMSRAGEKSKSRVVGRTAWDASGMARYVRAFVSTTHSRETGDDLKVIEALKNVFHDGQTALVKARVVRSLTRTDIEVFVPGALTEVRKGDAVMAKIHIVNSEVRAHGFDAMGGLLRLVCTNGMTQVDESTSQRVIHRGDVRWRLKTAIEGSYTGVAPLLESFKAGHLAALAAPREDIISRLTLATKGRFPASVWEAVPHVWDADGELSAGNTVAGLANALTRSAQQLEYANAADVEAFAGEVLNPNSDAYRSIAA